MQAVLKLLTQQPVIKTGALKYCMTSCNSLSIVRSSAAQALNCYDLNDGSLNTQTDFQLGRNTAVFLCARSCYPYRRQQRILAETNGRNET